MKRDWPLVTVGIVTWNSEADLPLCLDGLGEQRYPQLELIVVDNASGDRSLELVRQRWPTARVIENSKNEGFCCAQNTAIRASHGEYYLPLNPDVQLLPRFMECLVAALESRPAFGSAVGKMWQQGLEDPPLLDAAGLFLDRRRHQYLRGHSEPDRGQYDAAEEVFGADGAAPLLRRSMLEDVALDDEYFDELYFGYMEDVDLAWRARLRGWKCWYEPQASASHLRMFKPGRRRAVDRAVRRIAVKNRYLTMLKNEGPEEWRRDWWRVFGYDLGIWAYILLFEPSSLGALRMLRAQWGEALARRRRIWSRVKATSRERMQWFT